MATNASSTLISNRFAQVAWVVRNIQLSDEGYSIIQELRLPQQE